METPFRPAPFRNRGVTLVEAVLYTSVALAIILGGLFFARQASLAGTVTEQIRILSALVSEGRSLYSDQTAFKSLPVIIEDPSQALVQFQGDRADSVLAAAGAIPGTILRPAPIAKPGRPYPAILMNEWDGDIYMVAGRSPAGVTSLLIGLTDIPGNACARLAHVDAAGNGTFSDGVTAVAFVRSAGVGRIANYLTVGEDGTDLSLSSVSTDPNLCGGDPENMDIWFTVSLR